MKLVEDFKIKEREEKKLKTIYAAFKKGDIEVFDLVSESKIDCKYVLNYQGQSVFQAESNLEFSKIIFCSINIMKKENINDTDFYPINVDAVKDDITRRFEKFNIILVINDLNIGPDIP